MGYFSYLCQICGKGIESSSFDGEEAKLFLIIDGKVVEMMEGEYDSYGKVFINDTVDPENSNVRASAEWKMDWGKIVDIHFGTDNTSGIAAYHVKCCDGIEPIPTQRSENDPNQGWGEPEGEKEEDWGSSVYDDESSFEG